MLRVKSFKISDDKGINELLENYRLAPGAHVFVSEGELCVPFEDGEPENNAQKTVRIKEECNTLLQQRELIVHSQKVVEPMIERARKTFEEAEANYLTQPNQKEVEATYKEAKAGLQNFENQKLQNEAEIARIDHNVELFKETIATLI